jgi:pyruvate formate lyase activating enzyme
MNESTCCPGCGKLLIDRVGFSVRLNELRDGCCPVCARKIEGVWGK